MVLNKESDSMSANEYLRAQKLGEKRYQAAVAKNEYPYLPVLDEIISPSDTVGEVNLGLQTISLDRVVGTATAARTTAFASNFMPILDYHTEFGTKWATLCESHIDKPVVKNVVYVNKKAVFDGSGEKKYVYTVNEDGYRNAVEVTVGDTVDDYTVIKSGLKAGEQVVIN